MLSLVAFFPIFACAGDQNELEDEVKSPCAESLVVTRNNRFVPLEMNRHISLTKLNVLFQSLSKQQIQTPMEIFSRVIKVPKLLAEEFGNRYLQISVDLSLINWPVVPISQVINPVILDRSVAAALLIRLNNSEAKPRAHLERTFAERFFSRRELAYLVRKVQKKISGNTAISEKAVKSWWSQLQDDGKGPAIWIDLSGLTLAETDAIINTIANQLQAHTKGRRNNSHNFETKQFHHHR